MNPKLRTTSYCLFSSCGVPSAYRSGDSRVALTTAVLLANGRADR